MKILQMVLLLGFVVVELLSLGGRTAAHGKGYPHVKDPWPVPEESRNRKNPTAVTEASLSSARDIYRQRCIQCHGETGKGDGPDAAMYAVKPADFSDAYMMSGMSDGEIFYKISEGRRPMPSFKKRLTEEQRWHVVNFLRAFARKTSNAGKN